MAKPRTGETVTDRLAFRPGLNSLIGVMSRDVAPPNESDRVVLVAGQLAAALGAPLEYCGDDASGMTRDQVYVIGQARPVYVGEVGEGSKRFAAWYERAGKPVGEAVHYFAIHVDWRGEPAEYQVPVGIVAFPRGTAPRVISANWPDGDADAQRERLSAEATDAGLASAAAAIERAEDNVSAFARRYGFPWALLVGGAFGIALAIRLGKR